jgi:hypothetical protein
MTQHKNLQKQILKCFYTYLTTVVTANDYLYFTVECGVYWYHFILKPNNQFVGTAKTLLSDAELTFYTIGELKYILENATTGSLPTLPQEILNARNNGTKA